MLGNMRLLCVALYLCSCRTALGSVQMVCKAGALKETGIAESFSGSYPSLNPCVLPSCLSFLKTFLLQLASSTS